MSEEQLSALLAKLNEDAGFREKLQAAADLDAAVAMIQEAGFNVSMEDLLKLQAQEAQDLSDADLERITGGGATPMVVFIAGQALQRLELSNGGECRAQGQQPSTYVRGGTAYNDCV